MSTPAPDPTPDLTTAVWRELAAIVPTLTPLGLGSDALAGINPEVFPFWVFPDEPKRTVDGTGLCSVICSTPAAWAGANRHNTARFPRLQIEVYADVDRSTTDAPSFRSARRKAADLWAPIDALLHRPDGGGFYWGDANGRLRIVSCERSSGEPSLGPVPETDGSWRLLCDYAVVLG